MSIRHNVVRAAIAVLCSSALYCNAGVLYSNDFGTHDASGWSLNGDSNVAFSTVPRAASGYGSFLGEYGAGDSLGFSYQNDALKNSRVTLTFSFFAIRSWDGNDPLWGRDYFKVSANNAVLLDKTFSNGGKTQSFTRDGAAQDGTNDQPMAGSVEQYSLGYRFWDGINRTHYDQDAVYRISLVFDSISDLLNLSFVSSGLQRSYVDDPEDGSHYLDESWGLDNVQIAASPLQNGSDVPEPATAAMVLLGLLAATRALPHRSRPAPRK